MFSSLFFAFSMVLSMALSAEEFNIEIDMISLQCIGCHDEKDAFDALLVTDGSRHPVGGIYPKQGEGLIAMASLNSDVFLPEGRVGCVSCHNALPSEHEQWIDSRVFKWDLGSNVNHTADCNSCHVV